MNLDYDAIVIGGGPGGLAIGSLLAKRGKKTAVLEKAPWLGGRMRSVEFAGCRVDNGVHLMTGNVPSKQDTYCKQLFNKLGLPLKQKDVAWTMGLVGRDGSSEIEFFTMDRKKGIKAFFEFFSFGANMEMPDDAKEDMAKLFDQMADTSYEERRKLVNVSWKDYMETNTASPLTQVVFTVEAQLSGSAPDQISAGSRTSYFHLFPDSGAVPFWYPEEGTLEDAVVTPLAGCIEDNGGEVIKNCAARKVTIENDKVTGVWAKDNASDNLYEFKAPIVVSAVPIQFAVGEGRLMPRDIFSREWLDAIDVGTSLADEDLTGIYLLKEKVVPDDYYGWIHVFNSSEAGMPVYVGDWLKGDFVNATVPEGKQLISTFITASNNTAPFGEGTDSRREDVKKALAGWEQAMERAFPGFQDKIEQRLVSLQLNWGRYALGVSEVEIDVKSPNIKGLYFAGDSIRNVKSLASDCVFEIAMICDGEIAADN